MWSCPAVKAIWSMRGNKVQKRCIVNEEFVFILEKLLQFLSKKEIELIAVVVRMLWL